MAENGGITDDRYITNPAGYGRRQKRIFRQRNPNATESDMESQHQLPCLPDTSLQLRFYKEKQDSVDTDSVKITQVFVPVTSFIHTLQVDLNNRNTSHTMTHRIRSILNITIWGPTQ